MIPAPARFHNRTEAGKELAASLAEYADRNDVVVLALPRGGVPVAYEIANRLHAPLDVYTVRKLGVPGHEELAMGAIAADGSYVVDEAIIELAGVTPAEFEEARSRELDELQRRESEYRAQRPFPALRDKIIIIVDDGLATGATMRAAIGALRTHLPAKVIVAVPVGSSDTCNQLRAFADDVVVTYIPVFFRAVGLHYDDFAQVGDDEVRALLDKAALQASHH